MDENEISGAVVDACLKIHRKLGPGLLESVYEEVLAFELQQRGFFIQRQAAVPVVYDEVLLELGFRADIIVGDKVLVELKSVEQLRPVHKKQVLTYLKLTGLKVGLLINFNESLMRHGITRIVNNF
jgi:GxxExxY protein